MRFLFLLLLAVLFFSCDDQSTVKAEDYTNAINSHAHSFIDLTDGRTHYQLTGPEDGPLVILLHGANLAMWIWDEQVNWYVSQGFRVLRYDQFGRGFSDKPSCDYDLTFFYRQYLELRETLQLDQPAHLAGHSFGGILASYFTVHDADRIASVVYLAVGVYMPKLLHKFLNADLGVRLLKNKLDQLPQDAAEIIAESEIPADPYTELFRVQTAQPGYAHSVISLVQLCAGDRRELYREAGTKGKKMVIIWASEDKLSDKKQISSVKERIPGIKDHLLEGAGHAPHFSHKAELQQLLTDFYKNETQ